MKQLADGELWSHIVPVVIPGNERLMGASRDLKDKNFDVPGIRYPTVARGAERLRICLNISQTREDLDEIWRILESFL